MKRSLLFLTAFCLSAVISTAQWQATNLTSVTYLSITGVTSHQNELYATVFSGFGSLMYKLDPGNTSWTQLNTGTLSNPNVLRSAGTRMYVSTLDPFSYSSLLYYTTDGGNTFVLDTAGLPHYQSGLRPVSTIQYYEGKVIVGIGGDTYFLKDTSASAFHSIDTPTLLVGGVDPITFFNDTLYVWESSSNHLLSYSSDWGTTWTVRPTNLPFSWNSSVFTADEVTGRLYIAGQGNGAYELRYSDDHGSTWNLAGNIAPYIGLNANNTQQLITTIYAHDPLFYLSLENNNNSSAPDILGSVTGFANAACDTLGLPTNAAGAVKGSAFLMHNNKLALALNVIDVYLKDVTVGIENKSGHEEDLSVFPNPGSTLLKVTTKGKEYSELRVYDALGRPAGTWKAGTRQINVSEWQAGVYVLEFIFEDGVVTRKFIRE